jgi:recombination protein RecA
MASKNGNSDGRDAALSKTLDSLNKRFGDGAIMRLGDAQHLNVETIPTGSLSLDIALGVGGVPRGRVVEIYGPESSGKTTLCQHIIAEAQNVAAFAPSSTWNTPWTPAMPPSVALT